MPDADTFDGRRDAYLGWLYWCAWQAARGDRARLTGYGASGADWMAASVSPVPPAVKSIMGACGAARR